MYKLAFIALLLLTSCKPIYSDEVIIDDAIGINKGLWVIDGNVKPYPFTTDYGYIACSMNEVYYYPDYTADDETQIGLPVNRLAQNKLKQDGLKPTVINAIKPNADLSEAIKIGLDHCKKVNRQVAEFG